jgi:hypothetical protein
MNGWDSFHSQYPGVFCRAEGGLLEYRLVAKKVSHLTLFKGHS